MSYTVVYYMGGTEMGEWHRCQPVATLDAANDMADSVERMGYVAYCRPTREWNVLGLPEGPPRRAPGATSLYCAHTGKAIESAYGEG